MKLALIPSLALMPTALTFVADCVSPVLVMTAKSACVDNPHPASRSNVLFSLTPTGNCQISSVSSWVVNTASRCVFLVVK
ncbi:hypothetical protein U2X73_003880 [Salmonella enterica]|nr:hypothetical protein [Salmonella enterica]